MRPAIVSKLSLFLAALFQFAVPASGASETTVFVNVTVVPMDSERTLAGHTVVVREGRIAEMGPNADVRVPADAERIDGTGKFLIPGFTEMHGHNPPPGSSREVIENTYFLFLANGVTTVRGMLGYSGQLELKEQVRRGELLGPTLYLAGPSFHGSRVHSPEQAIRMVREQKAEGWDLLKVHPGLRRDVFDAMARTADEVGIRFSGHVPEEVGLIHAIEKRQETIDHLDGYIEWLRADRGPVDREKLAEIVKLTRETNTAVVPTMVLWETIVGAASLEQMTAYPELRYFPAMTVAGWKASYTTMLKDPSFDPERAKWIATNRRTLLKALSDGGVTILFGTDAPQMFSVPGFSIHREMAAMSSAGMTNFAILQSATRNAGEHFNGKDKFGTVAVGQRADLVLLEASPLEALSNLTERAGVMVRGQWLAESYIRGRLAQIAVAATR
jgi:cytosine/adenosine deaminase-related metal-dependent hydrolase